MKNNPFHRFFLHFFAICLITSAANAAGNHDPRLRLTADEATFLANHQLIRVHNEKNWPPMNYYEAGEAKGYSIEYMNLLARRLGVNIEYITGPNWDDFLGMIKSKKLDVMLNIIKTEQREDYLLFTDFYMKSFTAIFTRDDDDIQTLDDLEGEVLAVPKGFYTEELIKEHYPKIKLYTTRDIHGTLLAVMEGYARASIGDLSVVSYLIKKYKTPGLRAANKIKDKRFSSILNLAVRDDWPLFHSALQKAMDSITDAEELALRNKWFGNTAEKLDLSDKEKEFIKSKKTLNIAITPRKPPYSFYEQGVAKGLIPEYMRLLAAQANIDLNFIWKRPGGLLQNKRADIIFDIKQTEEAHKNGYIPPPFARSIPGIFSKAGNHFGLLKELNGKRLGVVKNSTYHQLLGQYYKDINLILVDNTIEAAESVVFDKADAFIADYNESNFILQSTGIINIRALSAIKDSRFFSDISLAISNDHPTLQSIIKKITSNTDKAEIAMLKHDWLQLAESTDDELALTTWEREFLKKNNSFTFCSNIDWHPIDFIDSDSRQPVGIAIDTLKLIEKKIGHNIRISWLPTSSWIQSTKSLNSEQCDIVPAMIATAPRKKNTLFTKPYMQYRVVIITRADAPFVHSFDDISNEGIARHKGSGMINLLHNSYSNVSIVETENALDSFQRVASGEVYATVAILPVASHFISRYGLSNLKIAGFTDINYPISFAVNRNKPEVFSLLEKALANIEDKQHRTIFNRWVSIKVDQQFDYSLYIKTLIGIFAFALFFAYRHYQLRRYNKALTDLSVLDKLTQIYNRNRLDEVLEEQLNMLNRYQVDYSIIFIDVDHFKRINDKYGHLTGDAVLIDIAEIIEKIRRVTDIAGRWGGEEFLVICPNTDLSGATRLSEHLRKTIQQHSFTQSISCTCSFGIVQMQSNRTTADLLKVADKALYQAKEQGRNQVASGSLFRS